MSIIYSSVTSPLLNAGNQYEKKKNKNKNVNIRLIYGTIYNQNYLSISDGVIGPHKMKQQFEQILPCEYGFLTCCAPFEKDPFICK